MIFVSDFLLPEKSRAVKNAKLAELTVGEPNSKKFALIARPLQKLAR